MGSGTERWSGSSPADRRGRGGWGPDGAGLTDGSDPTRLWGLGWGLRQKSCMEVRQRPERAPGPRRGAEAGQAQGPSGAGLALQTAGEEGVSHQWVTWLWWAGPETPRTRKELSVPDPSGLPAKGHWGPCRQSGPRGGAEGGWLVQRGDRRPPPRGSGLTGWEARAGARHQQTLLRACHVSPVPGPGVIGPHVIAPSCPDDRHARVCVEYDDLRAGSSDEAVRRERAVAGEHGTLTRACACRGDTDAPCKGWEKGSLSRALGPLSSDKRANPVNNGEQVHNLGPRGLGLTRHPAPWGN